MLNLEIKELDFNIPENLEFDTKADLNRFVEELDLNSYRVEGTKLICDNVVVINNSTIVISKTPVSKSILLDKFSKLSLSIAKVNHKV